MPTAYQNLEAYMTKIALLSDVLGTLHWDSATMMPKGAGEKRGEQLAYLSASRHGLLVADQALELSQAAEQERENLTPWQQRNLDLIKEQIAQSRVISSDLVEARAKLSAKSEMTWRKAREENNFKMLLADMQPLFEVEQEIAAAKADLLGVTPYEALLHDYDPQCRVEDLDQHFDQLTAFLPEFLQKVEAKQNADPEIIPFAGNFSIEAQKSLGKRLMSLIGFDFDRGRLDVSMHPFCGGSTNDVRLTTRYEETEFVSAMMGVLHETGHAMYEQNRPQEWLSQPVGEAAGMAIHESQSLMIEMQAGRSREFLDFLAPVLVEEFCGDRSNAGQEWRGNNLIRLCQKVSPGFIRVDADEATYPAHIVLRYQIERALFAGELALADLPEAFNDGMEKLLGIRPPTDTLGCLQDIHWPSGLWGYFPTYTLGAMTAAQLFQKACAESYEILPALEQGNFQPLMGWLTEKIHSKGSFYPSSGALVEAVTGEKLSVQPFIKHLENRYLYS